MVAERGVPIPEPAEGNVDAEGGAPHGGLRGGEGWRRSWVVPLDRSLRERVESFRVQLERAVRGVVPTRGELLRREDSGVLSPGVEEAALDPVDQQPRSDRDERQDDRRRGD